MAMIGLITLFALLVINYIPLPGFIQGLISTMVVVHSAMRERKLWLSKRMYSSIKVISLLK